MKTKINLQELIEDAKAYKQQAQSKLVNIFWLDVRNYILFLSKDEHVTEELTIETFTKVLRKLSLYKADFDFRTWLLSIAHNTTVDFLRKKNKDKGLFSEEKYVDFQDVEPSPEQIFIDRQDEEKLEKRLKKLPENYRKLIQLRYLDGKKLKDIAAEMELSLANVKVSLMRAKKLLAEKEFGK
ncbi:MAG: RNA polymerase sigma factor [Flavobacteriaceae bacterium]|jgi:RNA polymerase sigma-70 factor (ECF subfamily)|nr:RNA polymerase sigma factor [Flavobacteriaceae bacterium]